MRTAVSRRRLRHNRDLDGRYAAEGDIGAVARSSLGRRLHRSRVHRPHHARAAQRGQICRSRSGPA
jgi:hypothetical protein